MGQKVNPHGIRVGVISGWDTQWFADKKNFAVYLKEDNDGCIGTNLIIPIRCPASQLKQICLSSVIPRIYDDLTSPYYQPCADGNIR